MLGMLGMWDVRCLVCGCEMFGMWDTWDTECSRSGMMGMWDIGNVGC